MNTGYRIVTNCILFILIFIAPWWFSLALVCIGLFFFESFYESVFFGLLLDGYQGVTGLTFFGLNIFFTVFVAVIFIVSIFLKTRLTFYSQ